MAPAQKTGLKTGRGGVPRPRGGGKKGRSGRRPFAITQAAEKVFNKFKLLDLAADIAAGDIWEQWTNKDGDVVSGPTRNGDRIAAIRFIADYAFGKPPQTIQGPNGGPVPIQLVNAPGLD